MHPNITKIILKIIEFLLLRFIQLGDFVILNWIMEFGLHQHVLWRILKLFLR